MKPIVALSKAMHHTSNYYREFITNRLYSHYILHHLHRGGGVSDNIKYYSQCLRLQIRAMKIDELACKSIGLSNCELMNLLNK